MEIKREKKGVKWEIEEECLDVVLEIKKDIRALNNLTGLRVRFQKMEAD